MKRVKRLWRRAIEGNVDGHLVSFLAKLKVLSSKQWRDYMMDSHSALIKIRQEKEAKRLRAESIDHNQNQHLRPPRCIKPTKSRLR